MVKEKGVMFFLILVFLTGCSEKFTHKSFVPENIDRITILPFLDKRENPDSDINFEKMSGIGNRVMNHQLKYGKNYRTVISVDIGDVASYAIRDLPYIDLDLDIPVDPESVDSGWIKQLGKSAEDWILVPVIEELSFFNLLIHMTATAKVSAYLFNKSTGELWWYCKKEARLSAGVVVYGLTNAMVSDTNVLEGTALFSASVACINELPERGEPYILSNK